MVVIAFITRLKELFTRFGVDDVSDFMGKFLHFHDFLFNLKKKNGHNAT